MTVEQLFALEHEVKYLRAENERLRKEVGRLTCESRAEVAPHASSAEPCCLLPNGDALMCALNATEVMYPDTDPCACRCHAEPSDTAMLDWLLKHEIWIDPDVTMHPEKMSLIRTREKIAAMMREEGQ